MTIPTEIQEICREFAQLAQKHKLHNFSVNFQPRYDLWDAGIHARWDMGRHGEDANELLIVSDFRVNTSVNIKVE